MLKIKVNVKILGLEVHQSLYHLPASQKQTLCILINLFFLPTTSFRSFGIRAPVESKYMMWSLRWDKRNCGGSYLWQQLAVLHCVKCQDELFSFASTLCILLSFQLNLSKIRIYKIRLRLVHSQIELATTYYICYTMPDPWCCKPLTSVGCSLPLHCGIANVRGVCIRNSQVFKVSLTAISI